MFAIVYCGRLYFVKNIAAPPWGQLYFLTVLNSRVDM